MACGLFLSSLIFRHGLLIFSCFIFCWLKLLASKGAIHEMQGTYPVSEVLYRSALELIPDHFLALERLGRVYLRYRETVSAAVQCFFKVALCNSSRLIWSSN